MKSPRDEVAREERERQLTTARANETTGLTTAERQTGHRKLSLALSAGFPVIK